MTAADRVNNSAMIAAAAKIGMFLTPILVTIGLFVIGNWLNGQAQAMSALDARVGLTETMAVSLDKRTTLVEGRVDEQAKETAQVIAAVDALVTAINNDRLASTRNDAEIRKDVGYLRDWVEEQKRMARK